MKPERILPVWHCPNEKHTSIYTEPGQCRRCGTPLKKFTPVNELPHVFRCKKCRGVFADEPPKKKDHLWLCPDCGTPTIMAYACDESYLDRLRSRSKPLPLDGIEKGSPYQFGRTVKKTFQVTDAISRAAFKAQQLAERLSHRRPQDRDEKGYIDAVEFDISRFNIRAQMVVEMVVVKSLLEEAGLPEYVAGALDRILDARLGLRIDRKSGGDRKPETTRK